MKNSGKNCLRLTSDSMQLSETEKEMLESERVCANFDFNTTKNLALKIGASRIIFTGAGSSVIFPAKQAKNRALHLGIKNKIEACFASDLFQYTDFSDTFIFLCSNSGKTKEVILLLDHVKKYGGKCIAVTAVADSILSQRCDDKIILTCGFEKGVAATKSVIEQGLVYDSLIFHLAKIQGKKIDFEILKKDLADAGKKISYNVNKKMDAQPVKKLAESKQYFICGLETGVAEEISLKTYEIARKMGIFYPDTHIVHGPEEAIDGGCAIIFEPSKFEKFISDFQRVAVKSNITLVGIDNEPRIEGLNIEINETFRNYCLLSGGWALLRNVANYLQIDIDHPQKATKIGNPFTG